jgi:O-antigen/teichoic acid export membrane protein
MTNKTESLKKNVLANYLGNGWTTLMNLAFIPLYIKYLGMEAYGLIGIYAILQASLAIVDGGMSATLGREMARFLSGAHTKESIRDLLRSIEITGIAMASLYFLLIWGCSDWMATYWLKVGKIPIPTVSQAFTIMGIITSLRLIEGLYRGAITGLQKLVVFNACNVVMATMRGVGAVVVLEFYSPTIEAYFAWQAVISILTLGTFITIVYKRLPVPERPARFSKFELLKTLPFATGMLATTSLALLLTHLDKFILSKVLPLEEFGRYSLTATVASTLLLLTYPIINAYLPKLTEIFSSKDISPAKKIFHRGAQLVTIVSGTSACLIFSFGDSLLGIWTGNAALGQSVGYLLKILTIGTMMNSFTNMPFLLPIACGNSKLNAKVNLVAVIFLAPANLIVTPVYGAIGAAWVWVTLNLGYLFISNHFMFKVILSSERKKWFVDDVFKPFFGSLLAVGMFWLTRPKFPSSLHEIAFIALAGITGLSFSTMMASEISTMVSQFFRRTR